MKSRRDEIGMTCGRFVFNVYGVCMNPEKVLSSSLSDLDWAMIELEVAQCPAGWIYGGTHVNGVSPCMTCPPYFATREECIRAGMDWLRKRCGSNITAGFEVALNRKALAVLNARRTDECRFAQLELF